MSTCKGCGKEILWATTKEGKRIPLDATAPVYMRVQADPSMGFQLQDPVAERVHVAYVSHFATCPKANQFSASRRKP